MDSGFRVWGFKVSGLDFFLKGFLSRIPLWGSFQGFLEGYYYKGRILL